MEHYAEGAFRAELIETLRLCRAALLYFVEMVDSRERTADAAGLSVPLFLPPHHEIRGDDEGEGS